MLGVGGALGKASQRADVGTGSTVSRTSLRAHEGRKMGGRKGGKEGGKEVRGEESSLIHLFTETLPWLTAINLHPLCLL